MFQEDMEIYILNILALPPEVYELTDENVVNDAETGVPTVLKNVIIFRRYL